MEIIDYPDYLIYPDGRVWSKPRKGTKGGYIKHYLNSDGYWNIQLSEKSKGKSFKVHRLLAIHFIPNPHNYPQVDHINRIKLDNRLENLRWVTPSMNCNNKGEYKNNTSGHKYINYQKGNNRWEFKYTKRPSIRIQFQSKIDCVCYKFIYILKIKTFHK